jgi:hypothetical protein
MVLLSVVDNIAYEISPYFSGGKSSKRGPTILIWDSMVWG